jgi:Replication-relaxation
MPAGTRKYTSRWTPKGKEPKLSPRHIEAFRLLTRYKYLTRPYFQAFLGGDKTSWQVALLNLTGAGYLERPKPQRNHYNANYRPLVYSLGDRGLHTLQERGVDAVKPRAHQNFAHELMTSELMASFELGVREAGLRLLTWSDILKSESLPEGTRRSPKPYSIPVRFNDEDHHVEADGHPFGIVRIVDGRSRYFFCPGIEADCATEPLETDNFKRSSIIKKLHLYLEIEKHELYRSYFGFPNILVPFITTNSVRLHSMKEKLRKITNGKGSKIILFGKPYPAFTTFERPLPPSGHALTSTYERVGYPSFNFLAS